ncbi:MAG TPA: bifunctional DNA primase/polymerase, partial [Blastocatellia bacterium]|nr:bifunctional DNA primase/polymerase [Blastocatellia bacterium]
MANHTTSRNLTEKDSDQIGRTAQILSGALAYLRAGLSIVPIKANSKAPSVSWTAFQTAPPTESQVRKWFEDGKAAGIGIVCGKVSGNLELLDLESIAPLETFAELVEQQAPGLLAKLPRTKTPSSGQHIAYRCAKIEGNQKLAMRAVEISPDDLIEEQDPRGKTLHKTRSGESVVMIEGKPHVIKTLIETRGEGGQFLSPLCPPGVHPSGGVYESIHGDLLNVPTITEAERAILFQSAMACNEYVRPKDIKGATGPAEKQSPGERRPGDDYNQRGDVRALLNRHGWYYHSKHARGENWSRPGVKDHCGATLFDDGLFYVYTSNAEPLTEQMAYTPFALYAFLECDGDFKQAAKELAADGYGAKPRTLEPAGQNGSNQTEDDGEKKVCGAYEATRDGLIFWQQTKDGIVPARLTNFRAEIVADVVEDDGTETKRAFEVTARLGGRYARFLVPAEDFAMMKWPMVNLGAKAVIYPRRADHARCAIQMLSEAPAERRIYTHTGWREIDGEMCYLHGGGAIGAKAIKDVEVKLPDS